MISEVDRGAMSIICTLWGRHVEAELMIERAAKAGQGTGLFVKTPNGHPIQSPWVSVSNRAIELYKSYLSEFGLSPAARCRVTPSEMQLALPGLEIETVESTEGDDAD
jgi:P27 family predicted phage terminase small subunit